MDKNELIKREHESAEGVIFGFWLYLMTDLLMFAVLFAAFIVLKNSTFGGITIKEIFDPPYVLTETLLLLTSSFTCALAMLFVKSKKVKNTIFLLTTTLFLGFMFLVMELTEFSNLFAEGHTFQKSAFLSSYFTLVGTHGLHITIGSFWLVILLVQLLRHGLTHSLSRKIMLASLFWHFLDIVWIFIFTIVYLMGGIS